MHSCRSQGARCARHLLNGIHKRYWLSEVLIFADGRPMSCICVCEPWPAVPLACFAVADEMLRIIQPRGCRG